MSVPTSTPEDFAALQPDSIKAVLEGFDPSLASFSRPAHDLLLQDRRWDTGKAFGEMTPDEQSRFVETTAASLLRMSGCDHALALCSDTDYWTIVHTQLDESLIGVILQGKNTSVSAIITADPAMRTVEIIMIYDEGILAVYDTSATNQFTQLVIARTENESLEDVYRRCRTGQEPEKTVSTTTGAKGDFVFLRDSFGATQQGDIMERLKEKIRAHEASLVDPSADDPRTSINTADPEE